ncbi:MAG: hypothetical protein M1434_13670 [Chloroflexi bacterium]|nr:hypothetical protein [Chloroflexota bacterium]MCL5275770.1 hypothetical protein [Chloroflexota bacterium]
MDIWYHGSPLELSMLLPGSTITRERHVAEVFSHKPSIVSLDDDGSIRHNGRLAGFLYAVDEAVSQDDIEPHPRTTMPAGWEWLTRRPLRLKMLGPVDFVSAELLDDAAVALLREKAGRGRAGERE